MPVWSDQVRFSRKLGFFRPFLRYRAELCKKNFNLFVAFMVVKMTVLISRFQHKNRFYKRTNLAQDIFKNVLRLGEPNQTAALKQFLINISSNIGSFYKPIFALKPSSQDGRFDYHESHKQIFKNLQNLAVYLKNGLKKPNLQENLT